MSRIGKLPIDVPANVSVVIDADNTVTVKGPKGTLMWKVPQDMLVQNDGKVMTVARPSEAKHHKALHGLSRSLLANMVTGVSTGFSKTLEINGTGYRASKQGNKLVLNVGYSHPVEMEEPAGITIDVPAQNKIIVNGIDKQLVGVVAADIRAVREPEPYLGKGIKYSTEIIRRKEGKTGKK